MTHPLIEAHLNLVQQADDIGNQLLVFAQKQLELMQEAATRAGFDESMDYSFRFLRHTATMDICAGHVSCTDRGSWGGSDEYCGDFDLDPLVIDGKHDEFMVKQIEFFKNFMKTIQAKKIQDAQHKVEAAKAALIHQQAELAKKLAAME